MTTKVVPQKQPPADELPENKVGSFSDKINELGGMLIKRVSLVEKMVFTRHLAVMIESGLSLNQALEALAEQNTNPAFRKVIQQLNINIRQGKSFSESLARHPKVFNNLYISMSKVGETGGNLVEVLKILAEQMKKDHDLISRVRGAMMYPAVIVIAMLGIGVLMMIKVIPQLTGIFLELNVDLPRSTQIVIAISNFLRESYIEGALIIIGFIIGIKFALNIPQIRRFLSKLSLHLPILGSLICKINSARFARTLGSLIESGVAIVKSLRIVSDTLGNVQFKEALARCANQVRKGKNFSATLAHYNRLFPPMVVQMIKVGEETGNLTDVLINMAEFYEEEIDNITKNMSSIIEPILMLIIGGVVGFFAVSMLQPMYSMMGGI